MRVRIIRISESSSDLNILNQPSENKVIWDT